MNKPRAIFEDVAAPAPAAGERVPLRPGASDARRRRSRRFVAIWLFVLAGLMAGLVLIGGATRLTDSSLAMLSWHPVLDAVPPMSDAAWAAEFEKYKQTAQFRELNAWMTVDDFKAMYWWEWGHRQFGLVIAIVWAAGLIAFTALRMIPPGYAAALIAPGALGAVRAVVGIWMVDSGAPPDSALASVAPYRLAIDLGLAFLILGLLLWPAWRLMRDDVALLQARRRRAGGAMAAAGAVVGLAFVEILLGALVSGNDAGRGYVDWPLMNGAWFPPESLELSPLWTNFVWNDALTQFNHRVAGYALGLAALVWVGVAWASRQRAVRRWAAFAALAIWAEGAWGVLTVMQGSATPFALAHQAGALATFAVLLRARFAAAYPPEQSAIRA